MLARRHGYLTIAEFQFPDCPGLHDIVLDCAATWIDGDV